MTLRPQIVLETLTPIAGEKWPTSKAGNAGEDQEIRLFKVAGDPISQQPLSGQKRLRVFLDDDQEFQRRLLRFPRALFPASDGIGAHIEVLRERRLVGIELPANPPDFPRSKLFGSRRKMCDAEVDVLTPLVRPHVLQRLA